MGYWHNVLKSVLTSALKSVLGEVIWCVCECVCVCERVCDGCGTCPLPSLSMDSSRAIIFFMLLVVSSVSLVRCSSSKSRCLCTSCNARTWGGG